MSESLVCRDERRRHTVRNSRWNGLDYVEVSEDQLVLTVFFLNKKPDRLHKENVRIDGGTRIRDIRIVDVRVSRPGDPEFGDHMTVTVDRPGDFSTYTLRLIETDEHRRPTGRPLPGFDPWYDHVDFNFKINCPADGDCAVEAVAPSPAPAEPEINYLAKDYSSFRQAMLTRLSLIMSDWKERHVSDLEMVLIEVMAYTGDYLSYYQDAVATEAYLHTARKRISVRRHAKLVDYILHEGCNARTWVHLETDSDVDLQPADICFTTCPASLGPDTVTIGSQALQLLPADSYEVFEPVRPDPIRLSHWLSEIHIYTWGNRECCLPRGATQATLVDGWDALPAEAPLANYKEQTVQQDRPRHLRTLRQGQFLLLEEVLGPLSGQAADADPTHRQVVRLTSVTPAIDELSDQPVVNVAWSSADALLFPLSLSGIGNPPHCELLKHISVARGNMILADHGRTNVEDLPDVAAASQTPVCQGERRLAETAPQAVRYYPALKKTPLTYRQTFKAGLPASASLTQDHRLAWPVLRVTQTTPLSETRTRMLANADTAAVSESGALRLMVGAIAYNVVLDHAHNNLAGARDAMNVLKVGVTAEVVHHGAGCFLLIRTDDGRPVKLELYDGDVEITSKDRAMWMPRPDLFASTSRDNHFVVEVDDEGRAHLRFGDGDLGRALPPGAHMQAEYRTGSGPAGNVGAESISLIVFRRNAVTGVTLRARNPMAAIGGRPAESLGEARMNAPQAFRATMSRAITAADYARLAERHPKVQRAAATLTWTGSWHEVEVAIDPLGTEDPGPALLAEVERQLYQYKRIGHDLVVKPARYVALDIEVSVCVLPHYQWPDVKAALQARFVADVFNPDLLTFGGVVSVSGLVAAAQSVTGVRSVNVTRLERFGAGGKGELQTGLLSLAPGEIARVGNDPNFPERGHITFKPEGVR